jgi:hypothetical protein
MMATVTQVVLVGVTGAFSISVIDGTLTRLPWLNSRVVGRALSRLAIASALAYGAWKIKAPPFVYEGLLAGAVLVTTLDTIIAAIPRRRLDPPPPQDAQSAGLPWGPQPMYSFGTAASLPSASQGG